MKRDKKFERWFTRNDRGVLPDPIVDMLLEVVPASESGLELMYNSPVTQTAWEAWKERQAEIDELRAENERLKGEFEKQWYPERCPLTLRPFFMVIDHPEKGPVPTYGGPYDSYTIPQSFNMPLNGKMEWYDIEFVCERYDHDEGCWLVDEAYSIDKRLVTEEKLIELGVWDD